MSRIAIMQPYFFPHLAYFQLIHASDKFIFYDDVNFKPQGWIHRNRILIQEAPAYITIPCKKASQQKLINDVEHGLNGSSRRKILRKIKITYANAPFFDEVYDIFENVIGSSQGLISELAIESVTSTMSYLKMETDTDISSEVYDNQNLSGQDRVIDICKKENGGIYINSKGGVNLYNLDDFRSEGLDLKFLYPEDITYKQFSNKFVSSLSILDVMMFNDVDTIQKMLGKYQLG